MSRWLWNHRGSVLLAFVLLAALGALSIRLIPVGLFPLASFPRIVVAVDAGDRPVDRMVVEVTRPLEQALRAVPNVTRIRSTSSRGEADISLSFDWNTNMMVALLQADAVVARMVAALPAGSSFTIRRMDPTVFPVLGFSVTSPHRALTELRDLANFKLAPALSSVSGVAQVEVLGGREAEYQVLLDPVRLQSLGLSPVDVAQALSAANVVTAVGRLEDRYRLYLALSDTRLRSIEDIRRTVLRSSADGVIELEDVGDVRLGEMPEWTRVNADGTDAVLINVMQQRGASTVALSGDVHAQLQRLLPSFPRDVRIVPYYDQSELVVASAGGVVEAIAAGAVLAGAILMLFLRNWRMTLVVSLVLPVVLLITCALLLAFGQSFNIMTLGGMAAAVGLVVDDAVVMIEHMARRLFEDRDRTGPPPVLDYAAQMLRPLAGSSAATMTVFLPLAFLGGVAGAFFRPLALTMASTLAVSFVVSLLVVPLLTRALLRPSDAATLEHPGPWQRQLQSRGVDAVERAMQRPVRLIVPVLVLVLVGVVAFLRIGSGFMPRMDEGGFILDYRAAPGTSLSETDRLMRQVESIVRSLPEVESYSRRTGLQLGGGLTEANEGDMFIKLKSGPRRGIDDVMSELRQRVESEVPGLQIETAQLMEDVIGDLIATPQPIEIKLFGADNGRLRKDADTVADAIARIPGVVEVLNGTRIAGDAIDIRVDRVRSSLEGLAPDDATAQIEQLLAGTVTSQIQAGEKMIGIRVWSPEDIRSRVEQVSHLQLRSPDGHYLPVSRVAAISVVSGQAQEDREDLRGIVAVTARLEGRDLGSAMRDVRQRVASIKLAPGVGVAYGGLYEEQRQSFRQLVVVFVSALLLVATLLMFLYERASVVMAIVLTVLATLPGVFAGLWLTGSELNLSSMIGMTMVLGIATEVAIFFFAELDTTRRITPADLHRAAAMRLRPILMTSSIAILALLPLAFGLGSSEMQRPLAITIICGLLVAVPAVLLLMPATFLLLDRMLERSPRPD